MFGHRVAVLLCAAAAVTLLATPRLSSLDYYVRRGKPVSASFPSAKHSVWTPYHLAPSAPPGLAPLPPRPPLLPSSSTSPPWSGGVASHCPAHRTGHECRAPSFSACHALWGFNASRMAPCFVSKHPTLPATCECLIQCESGVAAARIDCLHDSPILRLGDRLERVVDLGQHTPPWKGHPKNLSKVWPELRVQLDPVLFGLVHVAARASRLAGLCGGRGVHRRFVNDSKELAALLRVSAAEECSCLPGHMGDECAPIGWHATNCLNSCSGAGVCDAGTCICRDGAAGIDCSDRPLPRFEAANARPQRVAATAEALQPARVSPRIFVHEPSACLSAWRPPDCVLMRPLLPRITGLRAACSLEHMARSTTPSRVRMWR